MFGAVSRQGDSLFILSSTAWADTFENTSDAGKGEKNFLTAIEGLVSQHSSCYNNK